MNNKGILAVVSGFSGAGKGTVMKELLRRYDNYALSVSATTRAPRPGETDGVEYFFKTKEEFQKMIDSEALIEYACFVNNYYGTPRAYVEEQMKAGKDVILEIEIQGARNIRRQFPDALLLFITPPTADELKRRLVGRGTETMDVIASRLKRAAEEAEGVDMYDYLVVNDDLDACVENTHQLIQLHHQKASRNMELIDQIRTELRTISEGE